MTISRMRTRPVFNSDPRRLIGAKETFQPDALGYLRIGLDASTVVLGTTSWVGVSDKSYDTHPSIAGSPMNTVWLIYRGSSSSDGIQRLCYRSSAQ